MAKKRIVNLSVFLILTGIEILIALFVHDNIVRPFVGDVIVVAVIYYFIRVFFPVGQKYLLLYIFIFSVAVEFSQLLRIADFIGGDSRFLRILLGTSFSFIDILCYAAGCVITGIAESVRNNGKRVEV